MFQVKNVISDEIVTVYSTNIQSIPQFLIYENNNWKWVNSYLYKPLYHGVTLNK